LQNAPKELSEAYQAVNRLGALVLSQDTQGTLAELEKISGKQKTKGKAAGGQT
jgi:hypothetical protein